MNHGANVIVKRFRSWQTARWDRSVVPNWNCTSTSANRVNVWPTISCASAISRPPSNRSSPPDRVWLQIAGRLRQEGRIVSTPLAATTRRLAPLALAASLLLVVGASLYVLYPRGNAAPAGQDAGNATRSDAVQGVETELRIAEQHYENAIAKLQEIAKSDDNAIDPQAKATLQKNLAVIDQAIAESRAALKAEPQSAPARNSLFDALKRQGHIAAGHDCPDESDAQGRRGWGRAESSTASTSRRPTDTL